VELGFTSTVGIIHDNNGQLKPLNPRAGDFLKKSWAGKRSVLAIPTSFSTTCARREHNWRCRSGSRYLYICEEGLVHWCSQHARGIRGFRWQSTRLRCATASTHQEILPRAVHSFMRNSRWHSGQLARPAEPQPMPMMPRNPQAELVQIAHVPRRL